VNAGICNQDRVLMLLEYQVIEECKKLLVEVLKKAVCEKSEIVSFVPLVYQRPMSERKCQSGNVRAQISEWKVRAQMSA